jgi:hypothetical protein
MLGLLVPHYARVVCGGIEMYHKGKTISVEVGSYPSTSTPVFVIDNGLSVEKSLESLIHHAGGSRGRLRQQRISSPNRASAHGAV